GNDKFLYEGGEVRFTIDGSSPNETQRQCFPIYTVSDKHPDINMLNLSDQIEVIGGGSNGLLGADRVHAGWGQNIFEYRFMAIYSDKKTHKKYQISCYPTDDDWTLQFFIKKPLPTALTPAFDADHPLLDSARPEISDGVTVTMAHSVDKFLIRPATPGVGEVRTIASLDTLSHYVLARHPSDQNAFCTEVEWKVSAISHLVAWTSETAAVKSGERGCALFSTIDDVA
ncbi:MAG: hypothetical protein ACREBW_02175, partial [Candidatus Micrarchaeaceae archaeon]